MAVAPRNGANVLLHLRCEILVTVLEILEASRWRAPGIGERIPFNSSPFNSPLLDIDIRKGCINT